MEKEQLRQECIKRIEVCEDSDILVNIYDLLVEDAYKDYKRNKRHCFYCGKDSLIKNWVDEECPLCGVKIKDGYYYEGDTLIKKVDKEKNEEAEKLAEMFSRAKKKREAKEQLGISTPRRSMEEIYKLQKKNLNEDKAVYKGNFEKWIKQDPWFYRDCLKRNNKVLGGYEKEIAACEEEIKRREEENKKMRDRMKEVIEEKE